MTKMVAFLGIAVVLFSVAAGASWYLQSMQHGDEDTAKTAEDKHSAKTKAKAKEPAHESKGAPAEHADRPITRPLASPEADKLAKSAGALQQQQEALKAREQQLVVREKQLETIHGEIKGEYKKLEGVRKEIAAELAVLQEKLELLEKRSESVGKARRDTDARIEEFDQRLTKIRPEEKKNTKQAAGIFEKMQPEAAAESIQQMVDKGELDFAVAIVANMNNRQAAELLSELAKQDSNSSAEIVRRIRYYKVLDSASK